MKLNNSPIWTPPSRRRTARSKRALWFRTICARIPAAFAGESRKIRCFANLLLPARHQPNPASPRDGTFGERIADNLGLLLLVPFARSPCRARHLRPAHVTEF